MVWLWDDNGETDAYVAFFGDSFPEGRPNEKPYVLRYFADSLEKIEET